eukprot:229544_1
MAIIQVREIITHFFEFCEEHCVVKKIMALQEAKKLLETRSEDSADGLKQLQTVALAPASSFRVQSNEHRLQTPWTLYWLNKVYLSANASQETYLKNLRSLGTFNSIESFWRHYCHLQRPSQLEHGFNIA